MTRTLVTGGAGFLGSHIVDAIVAEAQPDDVVIVIDDLSSGSADNLHEAEIAACKKAVGIGYYWCDVSVIDRLGFSPFDRIVHAASPASPEDHQRDAWATISANLLGAKNCLDALRPGGRMVFLSTSEVYGDPEVWPQGEDYVGHVSCTGPRAPYDEGKRVTEALLCNSRPDAEVRIARLFNTYGPRMRRGDGRVVTNFISQALEGRPLTVYGDGTQTRSLTWYADTVDGIMRLLKAEQMTLPAHQIVDRTPINIGNDQEISIMELAEYVSLLVASELRILQSPLPKDDPRARCPSVDRALHTLGWTPTTDWRKGVGLLLEMMR